MFVIEETSRDYERVPPPIELRSRVSNLRQRNESFSQGMRRKPLLENRERKLHQAIMQHDETSACEILQCLRIADLVGLNSAATSLCNGSG